MRCPLPAGCSFFFPMHYLQKGTDPERKMALMENPHVGHRQFFLAECQTSLAGQQRSQWGGMEGRRASSCT
jgi:hypothetical protein